jgi:hypothetical protein
MAVTSTPPGIPSASRLAGWIGGKLGEPVEVTDIRLTADGRSNLTYRQHVPGPGRDRVLVRRRPPLRRRLCPAAGAGHLADRLLEGVRLR